jgi:protein involved in polysaccharide export with SLBB domain
MLKSRLPALPAALRSSSAMLLTIAIAFASAPAAAQFPADSTSNDLTKINDPVSSTTATPQLRQGTRGTAAGGDQPESRGLPYRAQNYQPSEFELYVQQQSSAQTAQQQDEHGVSQGPGRPVRRFGANLVTDDAIASSSQDPLPSVPADYVVRPGDEVNITIWGSVDADLQATVDRAGRINVPRVGAITVAGVRNADLVEVITRRVGQTFRNFQIAVTLGQVRPIRVFVGGYVQHPGSITVNGLSSVLHALMRAGGPAAAGSFRDIHLRRAGKEVASFDLYDLLLKGDRNSDQLVQPDDILFVAPIGTQVAVLGSVNQPAIYELKRGETLDDVLRMAGGFTAVGDRSRVTIERLADRSTGKVAQLTLPAHEQDALATGDVIRAFSAVAVALPQYKQNEHVRVEGEVVRPGDYILPPGSRMEDALRAAGGMTAAAYPFGTEFTRESVRKVQVANYERALRDFETDIAKAQANQRVTSADELSSQSASAQANARLLERLRQIQPTGRVVLPLAPEDAALPNMALEDGDTLTIPSRGTSVGVFGSVFNTGNFVFQPGHTTPQYLALAGGPTRGADKRSIFMIRANGSVISAQQGASFWRSNSNLDDVLVQPGDTIFVPEELNKSTFVQDAKDWTQILYQFGLGLAGIKTLGL